MFGNELPAKTEVPNVKWKDVGGVDDVKKSILDTIKNFKERECGCSHFLFLYPSFPNLRLWLLAFVFLLKSNCECVDEELEHVNGSYCAAYAVRFIIISRYEQHVKVEVSVVLDRTAILKETVAPENFEGDPIKGHLQLMILSFSSTPAKILYLYFSLTFFFFDYIVHKAFYLLL
ncbi:hypothetical protein ACFX2F_031561 [Malus domestica]